MIDRFVRVFGLVLLLAIGATFGVPTGHALAQSAPAAQQNPKVEELLKLLNDPEVRAWLEKAPVPAPAATAPETAESRLKMWDDALRHHFVEMGAALRRLPAEIGTAMTRMSDEGRGPGLAILTLALLVGIGFAAERLVARLLSDRVSRALSAGDVATAALPRLVPVLVFAAAILIAVMFVGGSPLYRRILLAFLVAIVAIRALVAISDIIAALLSSGRAQPVTSAPQTVVVTEGAATTVTETPVPTVDTGAGVSAVAMETGVPAAATGPAVVAAPTEPVVVAATTEPVAVAASAEPAAPLVIVPDPDAIPVDEHAARFWQRRFTVFVGYFLVAWATLGSLRALGVSADGVQLLTYLAGIGLLAIAFDAVWRGPKLGGGERSSTRKWLVTLFLVLLWCVWSLGFSFLMWLGLYALLLPPAVSIAGRATYAIMERRGLFEGTVSRVREVFVVRGVRALVVLIAVLWLGYVLRINPGVLAGNEMFGGQLARAFLKSVLILLVADLIWQLAKAYIDGTIAASDVEPAEAARRGRLRTLLPIMRIALAVLVATVAGLMVLSELGVQVGPLVAGAGIFGVAIGFGSQTLVKDIISGMFYLMDDAFRVGEYIQSGSYKGTVEGFSLRSVRLRHHRGPVFTVPFGELGAVQNMSRDWSIDKFMLRLPFDTDMKLVKKLSKQVGAALLEDPDIAPNILETVKMKGVEQIGDYGIDISFAMKTLPGNQTGVRRRAYALLRDTFAANGIEFARPSVNVGGDDSPATAAAALAQKAKMDLEKLPAA